MKKENLEELTQNKGSSKNVLYSLGALGLIAIPSVTGMFYGTADGMGKDLPFKLEALSLSLSPIVVMGFIAGYEVNKKIIEGLRMSVGFGALMAICPAVSYAVSYSLAYLNR